MEPEPLTFSFAPVLGRTQNTHHSPVQPWNSTSLTGAWRFLPEAFVCTIAFSYSRQRNSVRQNGQNSTHGFTTKEDKPHFGVSFLLLR